MSGFHRAPDPDAARREAQQILSDGRFHSSRAPRPLRGPLEWIGDRLRTVLDWLGGALGRVPFWLLVAVLVGVVALVVWRLAVAMSRRHVTLPRRARADAGARSDASEDPGALERAADTAERAGDYDTAVRLRFRAGLLRLGTRGAIAYRPSVTTGEVRSALGSETFDDLASTFENVAYGGHPAEEPDVTTARRNWPRVLDESSTR